MAMHHTRAFVYESIDDQKENLEFWRDLTLSSGVVILTIFCPPAGAAAGFVLAGAEMYSATTGKDWGTGRELDTTERSLRAGFALFDLIPGVGYINDLAKSGSKVAAKEFIQTSIQKGMAQGAKNLDSFKQVLKHVKGFGDTILTNMDTYAKQLDTLVKSKVSSLADNLAGKLHHADEAISEAARNFRLNVGLEPQLVGGVMPSSSPGRLSNLADNLQAFAKSLDGSVDEVGGNSPRLSSFIDGMSPEDAQRYIQWNKYAEAGISPEDRVRVLEISEKAPKIRVKNGLNQQEYFEKITSIDKNVNIRPSPESYLDSDYIEAHRKQFDNGAAKFQKFKPNLDYQGGIVGGEDGTSFWLSKEHADIIEDVAKGDNRIYETLLGFDEGYLGDDPLYRLDVSPEVVAEKGVSVPSGNESGANEWWRPGGRTYPGDMPEGVMEGISTKEGDHTWNIVKSLGRK